MYPSLEHLSDPKNHADTVVEARVINDMKSHLSEEEFWRVVEHLFIVGVSKGTIKAPFGKRLPRGWSPKRHYQKKQAEQADALNHHASGTFGTSAAKQPLVPKASGGK
jgi:hypothetical protein